jgi:membrane protease YdiL (CAAX protease family)
VPPANDAKRSAFVALLLLVPVPSLGVAAAAFRPDELGRVVFAAGKLWLLVFPLIWLVAVDGRRPHIPRPSARGIGTAWLTGGLIAAVIVAAYLTFGRAWIDIESYRRELSALGLADPRVFGLLAVYWCVFNAVLEEYVWRWFVFTRCKVLMSGTAAVVVSALLFTVHHVLAMSVYFDLKVTLPASLGVWFGGAIWSWLYLTYRNIWAAYVSHVVADVAVFAVGYVLLF